MTECTNVDDGFLDHLYEPESAHIRDTVQTNAPATRQVCELVHTLVAGMDGLLGGSLLGGSGGFLGRHFDM